MDVKSVKFDLIRWLTELQDKAVLEKLLAFKDESEKLHELKPEYMEELENRLIKYEAGEMKFSSWDAVKNRVKNSAKDKL
ncbi:addiction module protein [Aquiflexum sp.]|uniref:addiction module protein n=1 Tax=Aquiflexum sp. TaxID=1872584 RepID=UPI0035946B33